MLNSYDDYFARKKSIMSSIRSSNDKTQTDEEGVVMTLDAGDSISQQDLLSPLLGR